MIRILISGALGRMGQDIAALAAQQPGLAVVAGVDPRAGEPGAPITAFPCVRRWEDVPVQADVCVDFSHVAALPGLLDYAMKARLPLVLATTGYAAQEQRRVVDAARAVPIFQSANMSYGIHVLKELAHQAAVSLGDAFDVEILERHHNRKIDAPSGTALMLAEALRTAYPEAKELVFDRHALRQARQKREIGVVALRGGTVPGEHEIGFYGEDEVITLTHAAQSRRLFAAGALRAACYIAGKEPGLYSMQQLLLEQSLVTHISAMRDVAVLAIRGVEDTPKATARLFTLIRDINIDMISRSAPQNGCVDISFSLPQEALPQAMAALSSVAHPSQHSTHLVKLTVEGAGMAHASGVASRVFDCLAVADADVRLITTSETKISVCVDAAHEQRVIAAIQTEFGL